MLFSALCCCLSRCKFFYRFRKWGRKVSCYFLQCVFVVLPHRASPLYTLDSPACILPRRYCTRNLLLVTVIRQVLAFTLLQALLQALLDILIVTHTRHFGALSILSCSCSKQVNNPLQMACLSDLFLLVAEMWQEACSGSMLQDRYKAYMGGGGW